MGWRVSWYKADKENPLLLKQEEDYLDIIINGELLLNDQGTNVWLKNKELPEFQKEIKCLFEDPDRDFYSITKEGFKMMILSYRQCVIEYYQRLLALHRNPESGKDFDYESIPTLEEEIERELRGWRYEWKSEGNSHYINLNFDSDKVGVSGSTYYKYAIFDLMFVYKTFDWDNYTMVVYGG